MDNIFHNCTKLDVNDKNYWQTMWKRKRFLNMVWDRIYIDNDMSWSEIFDYVDSGDFTTDVTTDIFRVANSKNFD